MATTPSAPRRGRPPAASRDDVLRAAMRRYLRGERIDVQSVAGELGLGRATIYRWFGDRDGLIGAVLVRAAEGLLEQSRAAARGKGAERLLDTFDRYNRGVAGNAGLRRFVDAEREAAVRILTRGDGYFQPRLVALVANLIEDEVRAGEYEPPIEPATLAYAIVRLGEAFIYNETATGMRGDIDRLREVQGLVLGIRPKARAR
jgi:AcrR family transcriptional regulator